MSTQRLANRIILGSNLSTLPTCICRWAFEAIVLAAGLMPDAELSVAVVGVLLNIGMYPTCSCSLCACSKNMMPELLSAQMHTAQFNLRLVLAVYAGWTWWCTADTA